MSEIERLRKEAIDYFDKSLEGGPQAKYLYELGWETLRRLLYKRACLRAPAVGIHRSNVQDWVQEVVFNLLEFEKTGRLGLRGKDKVYFAESLLSDSPHARRIRRELKHSLQPAKEVSADAPLPGADDSDSRTMIDIIPDPDQDHAAKWAESNFARVLHTTWDEQLGSVASAGDGAIAGALAAVRLYMRFPFYHLLGVDLQLPYCTALYRLGMSAVEDGWKSRAERVARDFPLRLPEEVGLKRLPLAVKGGRQFRFNKAASNFFQFAVYGDVGKRPQGAVYSLFRHGVTEQLDDIGQRMTPPLAAFDLFAVREWAEYLRARERRAEEQEKAETCE